MASTINATTSSGIVATADNTGSLALQSAGTTSATFNTYGMGLVTATPSSGIGISFPATQSASSDVNTLDDYKEGTFTPSVTGVTIGTATGIYIKIGKLVFIDMAIPVTSGANAGMTITNLPYTSWNGNRQVLFARENASTGKTGQLYIDSNSTNGSIQDYAGTSGGTNGYTWIITGTYQASA